MPLPYYLGIFRQVSTPFLLSMKLKKYTPSQLKEAVETSTSYREVLMKLNISPAGGNYKTLKKAIEYFPIGSNSLRKRLLKEHFFPHQCQNCKNSKWLDKPIPLELEHIDGNHLNNLLSNLTLLCPNCHSLTSTYRGRNKKKQ